MIGQSAGRCRRRASACRATGGAQDAVIRLVSWQECFAGPLQNQCHIHPVQSGNRTVKRAKGTSCGRRASKKKTVKREPPMRPSSPFSVSLGKLPVRRREAYGSGMNKKRLSDDSQTASGPMSVAVERLNISNRVK